MQEEKPSTTDNKGFMRETKQVVEETLRDLSTPPSNITSAEPIIEYVFVMDRTGFVLSHWKGRQIGGPERLADEVTAIEDFAVKNPEIKEGDIFFLKFQNATILVEPFDRFLLVAVVHGPESKEMYRNIHRHFRAILETHGNAFRQSTNSGNIPGLAQRIDEVFGTTIQTAPEKKAVAGQKAENIDEVIDAIMEKVPAKETQIKRRYSPGEVLKVLSSLPRGLPASLWGKSMEELSELISTAEYAEGSEGEIIVHVGNKWYYGDPIEVGTYLQEYKGIVKRIPVVIVEEIDEKKRFIHDIIRNIAQKMRTEGYDVASLERALDLDPDLAQSALQKFNEDLIFVKALEKRVSQLNATGFEKELAIIKRNLKNPSHAALTEKSVIELSRKIQEKTENDATVIERRLKRASAFIKNFKDETDTLAKKGFDTSLFDRALKTNDPELLEDLLSTMKSAIVKIEAVKNKMNNLDTSSHHSRVQSILAKAVHPSMSDVVEQEFSLLLAEIRDEEKRHLEFENLEEKLSEWQSQGIEVEILAESFTQDPREIRKAFIEFEKDLNRLQKLNEQLSGLDATGLEQIVLDLRGMMKNPANISKIEAGIVDLRDRIDSRDKTKHKRRELTEKMERWRSDGYDVHLLEKVLGSEIETVESEFADFEKNIAKQKEIETQLVKLDTEGFEILVKQIMEIFRKPDKATEASNLMDLLKKNIEQRDKMLKSPAFPIMDPKQLVPVLEKCKHLPAFLWGRSYTKMANIILESQLDESKNLDLLVNLGNKWYFGDPNSPDKFLKPFHGERVTKEEKRRFVIKSFQR